MIVSVRIAVLNVAFVILLLGFCNGQELNLGLQAMKRTGNACINLLMDKDFRKELNLDTNQVLELDTKIKALIESQGELMKMMQGARGAVDVQKFLEVGSKTRELQEETEESLAEILDPSQLDRLAEICVEKEGGQALVYFVVAERLKLSSAQRQKVARIRTTSAGLFSSKVASGKDFIERMKSQREKSGDELISVLTDKQKILFDSFKKSEFGRK